MPLKKPFKRLLKLENIFQSLLFFYFQEQSMTSIYKNIHPQKTIKLNANIKLLNLLKINIIH